ncbi:MAG TPA: hypothetical protein VGR19_09685 [Allosphingosinicella sp.]|nr:hypothetical protein [Allosphingosinicella sp.]
MKKVLLAGLAAAAFVATPAAAQMGGLDGDMTRAQVEQFAKMGAGRLDSNSDGTITRNEVDSMVKMIAEMGAPAAAGDRLKAMFARFAVEDKVNVEQMVKMQLDAFDKSDADGTGVLTAAERKAAAAAADAEAKSAR